MPSLTLDQPLPFFDDLLLTLVQLLLALINPIIPPHDLPCSSISVRMNLPSSDLHGLEPHAQAVWLSWYVIHTATPEDIFADCVKCNIIEI